MIAAMAEELPRTLPRSLVAEDFAAWMVSEQRRVVLICRRMLLDTAEADSVAQDVFLKAYKALHSPSGELSLANDAAANKWITRIAVNTCLDRLRSRTWKIWQRRPQPEDEQLILEQAASREPDAERKIFARQIQHRLETALGKLSARQRAVFSLRHYEELPLEEIAVALNLNVGSVKAHLFRAIAKLREELSDLYFKGNATVRE